LGTDPQGAEATVDERIAGVEAHVSDSSGAHAASAISYAGEAGISATDVERALDELATEKANASDVATDTELHAHITDASDAHDASAISYAGGTGMSATDVEAALDELATEKANAADVATDTELNAHISDSSAAHAASAISYAGGSGMSATDVEA